MKKINITIIVVVMAALNVFSDPLTQEDIKLINKLPANVKYQYQPIDFGKILGRYKVVFEWITKGKDGKAVSSMLLSARCNSIKDLSKQRWLEADTGIKREWFQKIFSYYIYLIKIKKKLELAKVDQKLGLPENQKLIQIYKSNITNLERIFERPEKVDQKQLLYLRRQQKTWLKYMYKKDKERLERLKSERRRNGGSTAR